MKEYVTQLRSIAQVLNMVADAQEMDDRMLKGRVREILYQATNLNKLAMTILVEEVLFE